MISVIIISYNVKSYLRYCIKTVKQSIDIPDLEIIVVDNYSFDNSVIMVKNNFPDVKIITNTENFGYAKAVNQGLKLANGDMICLLNPDTMIKEDTLSVLYKYLINNIDTGIVGCKVLDADGNLQLASRRSFPTITTSFTKYLGLSKLFPKSRYFGQYNQTYIDENIIQKVDAVSGACMMFRKQLIDTIGLMDEQYFIYFEDTDFRIFSNETPGIHQWASIRFRPVADMTIYFKMSQTSTALSTTIPAAESGNYQWIHNPHVTSSNYDYKFQFDYAL